MTRYHIKAILTIEKKHMITLFLKAHLELPIYLSIDLSSNSKMFKNGNGINIPAPGSYWEVDFDDYRAQLYVGKIEARNERICIYSSEERLATLKHLGKIVPWQESGNSYILTYSNHHE